MTERDREMEHLLRTQNATPEAIAEANEVNWNFLVKTVLANADLKRARAEIESIIDAAWAYEVDRAALAEEIREWQAANK